MTGATAVACPSFITIDSSTGALSVYTNTINDAGTYKIRITASHTSTGNLVLGNTYSIITILNPCSVTSIISSPLVTFHYDINQGNQLISTLSWTKNTSNCPLSVTYTMVNASTSSLADPLVFTVSSNSLYVNTTDPVKVRTYNIKARG